MANYSNDEIDDEMLQMCESFGISRGDCFLYEDDLSHYSIDFLTDFGNSNFFQPFIENWSEEQASGQIESAARIFGKLLQMYNNLRGIVNINPNNIDYFVASEMIYFFMNETSRIRELYREPYLMTIEQRNTLAQSLSNTFPEHVQLRGQLVNDENIVNQTEAGPAENTNNEPTNQGAFVNEAENNNELAAIYGLFDVIRDHDFAYGDIFSAHNYNYFEAFYNSDTFIVFRQVWENEYFTNMQVESSAETLIHILRFRRLMGSELVFQTTNIDFDIASEILESFINESGDENNLPLLEVSRIAELLVEQFPDYLRLADNNDRQREQQVIHLNENSNNNINNIFAPPPLIRQPEQPVEVESNNATTNNYPHETFPIMIPNMSAITSAILNIKSGTRQVSSNVHLGQGGRAWEVHDMYDGFDKAEYINILIGILENLANLNGMQFEDLIQNHVFDSKVPFRHYSHRRISRGNEDIKVMIHSYMYFFLEKYFASEKDASKTVDEEYWKTLLERTFQRLIYDQCGYSETIKIIAFLTLMIVSLCDENINGEYIKDFINESMSGYLDYEEITYNNRGRITGQRRLTSEEIRQQKIRGTSISCTKGIKERIAFSLVNVAQSLYGITGNPVYRFLRPICLFFGHSVSANNTYEDDTNVALQIIGQINAMDNPTFLQLIQEWTAIEQAEELNEIGAQNSVRDYIFRIIVPNHNELTPQQQARIKSAISQKVSSLVPDVRNLMGGKRRKRSKISMKKKSSKTRKLKRKRKSKKSKISMKKKRSTARRKK